AVEVSPGLADGVQSAIDVLLSGRLLLRLPGGRQLLPPRLDLLFGFDQSALPAAQRRLGRDRLFVRLDNLVEQAAGVCRLPRFHQRDAVVVAQDRDPAGPLLVVAQGRFVFLATFVQNFDRFRGLVLLAV